MLIGWYANQRVLTTLIAMKKNCSQCNQLLSLDAFDIQSMGKYGRRADCKECRKRFIRSKEGLVKQIYRNQEKSSAARGYAAPAYTRSELFAWVMSEPEFHALYAAWEASGFRSKFQPSIDRLDDYVSYRLDNIRVVTWNENHRKGLNSLKDGSNTKTNLAVDMLSLDGEFIQRFHSVSEAARQFNGIPSNIIGAINSRVITRTEPGGSTRKYTQTTAYGRRWRYSTQPNDNSERTCFDATTDGSGS